MTRLRKMKYNFSPGIASARVYRERGRLANKNNKNVTRWRTFGSTSTPKMQKDMKIYWQKRRDGWKSRTKRMLDEQKQANAEQKFRLSDPTKHPMDLNLQSQLYRTYCNSCDFVCTYIMYLFILLFVHPPYAGIARRTYRINQRDKNA